ncbi:hypothetical protein DVH24_038975 [Malus domestica]|uniref:Uncharacterized protein n=1 Tax=Malus domestica TaxID=3750 RepID=A0A498KBA1_MALDO|nr:hypothetical protein DVH24_038975 [Malus domestica]
MMGDPLGSSRMSSHKQNPEGAENGLEFTIVRPFNWIGSRIDFIPSIDGPSEGVPRVLACFSNNLLLHELLKLVDGGQSQRTFAIEAVMLMIVYAKASGEPKLETPTIDVGSQEFYGVG